jgi:hypothetical protein
MVRIFENIIIESTYISRTNVFVWMSIKILLLQEETDFLAIAYISALELKVPISN